MYNLQGKNIIMVNIKACKHFKGTVDHLSTRCDRMFTNEYTEDTKK